MTPMHLLMLLVTQLAVLQLSETETNLTSDQNGNERFLSLSQFLGLVPEATMSTTELIQYWGYPVEVHTVTTQDGYILKMHRIPHGRNCTADPNLAPILLVHGTFGFADNFLCNTPSNSFAYLLADAGFDVWVANQRGTEHSKSHKILPNWGDLYWQFSWDEIAEYDLPAFIDQMLLVTGKSQIHYSGHSLGGGLVFAMLAARPEYIPKIKSIRALGPMGNLKGFNPIMKLSTPLIQNMRKYTELFGLYELHKMSPTVQAFLGKEFEYFMRFFSFFMVGPDNEQWDPSRTEVHLAHVSSSMGLNVFYHMLELISTNEFKKYDWGTLKNIAKYGKINPPFYDLSGITVPSYLYYGSNDWFCTKENVQFLQNSIPKGVGRLIEAGTGWNHVSFIWGKTSGKVFYEPMIADIKAG